MKHDLQKSYDRSAASYDAEFRPLQREKYRIMLGDRCEVLAPLLAAGRLLDLGCGSGLLAEHLQEAELAGSGIVGLDFSAAMLAGARSRGMRCVQGDIDHLPFASRSFAAVLAFTVLRILPRSDDLALAEVARVLVPGGLFAVTVLAANHHAAFADELRAAGLRPGPRRVCGQDVGYLCRRA